LTTSGNNLHMRQGWSHPAVLIIVSVMVKYRKTGVGHPCDLVDHPRKARLAIVEARVTITMG
jgi:hypothetical protein